MLFNSWAFLLFFAGVLALNAALTSWTSRKRALLIASYVFYPRQLFWDRFVSDVGVPALHFEESAELLKFHCPNGSHLDFRDRANFTGTLVDALKFPLAAGR